MPENNVLSHVLSRNDLGATRLVTLVPDGFRTTRHDRFHCFESGFPPPPGILQLLVISVLQYALFLPLSTAEVGTESGMSVEGDWGGRCRWME